MRTPNLSTSTVLLIALLAICGCTFEVNDTTADAQAAETFLGDAGDACFESQMQVWLSRFQHHQRNGDDMFRADEKAKAEALAAFRKCHNPGGDVLATHAARKE